MERVLWVHQPVIFVHNTAKLSLGAVSPTCDPAGLEDRTEVHEARSHVHGRFAEVEGP